MTVELIKIELPPTMEDDDLHHWLLMMREKVQFAFTELLVTAGEANTAANVGADGVGVYEAKAGNVLQFRHVAPGSNVISVVLNGQDIDLDLVLANIDHNSLKNLAAGDVHTQYLLRSLIDAKGDLFIGTADNVVGRLPIGTDEYLLGVGTDTPSWKTRSDAIKHNIFFARDFATIQLAVDACETAGGGWVILEAGTYNEKVLIDSNFVKLKGAGRGLTILDYSTVAEGCVITINNANNCGVYDLSVKVKLTGTSYGVRVYGTSQQTDIRNVDVIDGRYGFVFTGTGGLQYLTNCVVWDCSVNAFHFNASSAFGLYPRFINCSVVVCDADGFYLDDCGPTSMKGAYVGAAGGNSVDVSQTCLSFMMTNSVFGECGAASNIIIDCQFGCIANNLIETGTTRSVDIQANAGRVSVSLNLCTGAVRNLGLLCQTALNF